MKFFGEYWFLSNSSQYPLDLEIEGKTYHFTNAESAFLACKAPSRAEELTNVSPKAAKALGKKFKKKEIREDWDSIKLHEMKRVLTAKFKDPFLRTKLLNCPEPITMDNDYHDTYWGLFFGKGLNNMGKCLEEVRNDIRIEMGLVLPPKKTTVCSYKVQNGGLVAFDTETTGLSAKYDDILQITIVGQDGAVLLDTYVKPENCTHWEDSEAIHGITPAMVKDAPCAKDVAKIVKKIFDKADKIIGYNVGFDFKMTEARFGYDFRAKEQDIRNKYPDRWKENVEKNYNNALLFRDDYKKAVEEMNYISLEKKKIRKNLKEILNLKAVKDIDNITVTPEILKIPEYNEYLQLLMYEKSNKEIISENKKSRCFKVLEEDGIDLSNATDEEIKMRMDRIAPDLALEDILPLYKKYTAETGMENVPHKLIHAVKELYPDKYDDFMLNAHNSAADTYATMEVAKALYKYFELYCPIDKSLFENKLFGLSEGIMCLQTSSDGFIQKGFTTRIYNQFGNLRKDFFSTIRGKRPEELFGKVKVSEISDNLYLASIFSRKTQGNAEMNGIKYTDEKVLVSRIGMICDKYTDKNIYLPVITENNGHPFVIIDGIGAGKGGADWNKLENAFRELNKDNLYFLDTQTGETERVSKELIKDEEIEEDDGLML